MGDYTAKLYRDYNEPTYPNYLCFRSAEKLNSSFSVSSFFHKLYEASKHASLCRGANTYRLQDLIRMTNYAPEEITTFAFGHPARNSRGVLKRFAIAVQKFGCQKRKLLSYCLAEDGGNMLYSILFDFTVGLCLDHEHCPFFLMSCFQALQAEVLLF